MLLCKTAEGYGFSNLAELPSVRGLSNGLLKICDCISFFEFPICVPELSTMCKEVDNRVFERSFNEVWRKKSYDFVMVMQL